MTYPELLHTIQTHLGMVRYNGAPIVRDPLYPLPTGVRDINSSLASPTIIMNVFQEHLRDGTLPSDCSLWLYNCLRGCSQTISMEDLKNLIRSGKRLDMEETASIVLSMLGRQIASELVPHLKKMFEFKACMWTTKDIIKLCENMLPFGSAARAVFVITTKMTNWQGHVVTDSSGPLFLKYLSRIRRHCKRPIGLHIPDWVYTYAQVKKEDFVPESAELLVVSKKVFSVLQRWIRNALGPSDESHLFQKEVRCLKASLDGKVGVRADGTIVDDHLKPLMDTNDTLALAYSFIAIQRKLQLKVVSDLSWTSFLKKGETNPQNDYFTPTSFEMGLVQMAHKNASSDWTVFNLMRISPGLSAHNFRIMKEGNMKMLLSNMKLVCRLMKQYVDVYGDGDPENLHCAAVRFNRGPVDFYNFLSTALNDLCHRYAILAKEDIGILRERNEIPGACRKFLAADIMYYNESWADDAFADRKEPPWSIWLRHIEGSTHMVNS